MMHIKLEAQPYPTSTPYTPKHPARWCWFKFFWSVLKNGGYVGVAHGELWTFEGHDWVCYFRVSPSYFGKKGKTWRGTLRNLLPEHRHRDFSNILAMGNIVNGAEDPYIEAHYEINIHTLEGNIIPWPVKRDISKGLTV